MVNEREIIAMLLHWSQGAVVMLQIGGTQLMALTSLIATVRPIAIVAFLFLCPGMIAVRFLKIHEPITELVLALALSLTIDTFLAGIFLYAGWWSPATILNTLIGLCLASILAQRLRKSPKNPPILRHLKNCSQNPLTEPETSDIISLAPDDKVKKA